MTQEEFLKDVKNWDNHRPLLWLALEATEGEVLELGCGNGSTPYLQKYCKDTNRRLSSYDYVKEWADRFNATHAPEWSVVNYTKNYSVVLVDESPGEHRKNSIVDLVNTEIIVVHDSEPPGWNASDYRVRHLFSRFKYVVDIKSIEPQGAWATALSNTIDVTKWKGLEFGGYKVS